MPQDTNPQTDSLNLTDFLGEVAKSLIQTQQQLNRESIAYNQQLPDGVPPAHFAIPAVRADLRMGFRNLSARGIDVVLFSNKEEKESYGESTVSFELVAAPPAPASLAASLAAAHLPPEPEPSSSPESAPPAPVSREAILDRIESLVNATAMHPNTRRSILGRRDAAVVVLLGAKTGAETGARTAADERVLVLWPAMPQSSVDSPLWSQMSIFVLKDNQFDTSLYDAAPPEGFLRLAPRSALLDRDKKDLVGLAEALGDLLLAVGRCAAQSSQP
jgi:hypothetical protein